MPLPPPSCQMYIHQTLSINYRVMFMSDNFIKHGLKLECPLKMSHVKNVRCQK